MRLMYAIEKALRKRLYLQFLDFDILLNQFCVNMNVSLPSNLISNNVECATSKVSDQPVHTHSLIRAFANHLSIRVLSY